MQLFLYAQGIGQQPVCWLQVGFFKRLRDVATVILDLVSVSSCNHRQTQWWWDQISAWSIPAVVRLFMHTKISLDYYN